MAKKSGLPLDYDLKVGAEQLISGPARIAGYLDTQPAFASAVQLVQRDIERPIVAAPAIQQEVTRSESFEQRIAVVPTVAVTKPSAEKIVEIKKKKGPRKQINLSMDAQEKLEELVSLFSDRSAEKSIASNDIIEGLILRIFDAKEDINLSELPQRGRWGTPTAKSFRSELAHAIIEGLILHKGRKGNPFKTVANG